MKSRRLAAITAGVAVVTASAVTASAVPNFLGPAKTAEAETEALPKVPTRKEIAQAKDEQSKAAIEKQLDEAIKELDVRREDVEANVLVANEAARSAGEAAAAARRNAEAAAEQASAAAEAAETSQEQADAAAADMYRQGGASESDVLLGDEDALNRAATGEHMANSQAQAAEDDERRAGEAEAVRETEQAHATALANVAREENEAIEARKALDALEKQILEAYQELHGDSPERAKERLAGVQQDHWNEELEKVLEELEDQKPTTQADSDATDPANISTAENAEITTPDESSAPTQTPSVEPTTQAPTPSATPTPKASATPSATATPTPTPSATPSVKPKATQTPTVSAADKKAAEQAAAQKKLREEAAAKKAQQERAAAAKKKRDEAAAAKKAAEKKKREEAAAAKRAEEARKAEAARKAAAQKAAQQKAAQQKKSVSTASSGSWSGTAINWAVNKANEPGSFYKWGGNGPKGYDCSGFTVAAFNAAGKSLPRSSKSQYAAAKQYVPLNQMRPGDLVFWSNNGTGSGVYHVAIYMGNNQMVHARNPQMGISVTALNYGGMHNILPMAGRY